MVCSRVDYQKDDRDQALPPPLGRGKMRVRSWGLMRKRDRRRCPAEAGYEDIINAFLISDSIR